MDQAFVVPAPSGAEGFVELAARTGRDVKGKLFRKHILSMGTLRHPKTGEQIVIDEPFYNRLNDNFESGACDIVQVPLADAQNKHSEDPARNLGEVVGLERDGRKIYAVMDIRDPDAVPKMGKTYLGASAFLHMNYEDTATGQKVGPTLLHTCVTNRPYVTGLDDYEQVLAATADGMGDEVELLLTEESGMDVSTASSAELIDALKAQGIDVPALQEQVARAGSTETLVSQLTSALQGVQGGGLQLSDNQTGLTAEDFVGAISELAELSRSQGREILALTQDKAASEVDRLIGEGRILPAQREVMLELSMDDRAKFDRLVPDKPLVPMSAPVGREGTPQGEQRHTEDMDAEIARLTNSDHTSQFFTTNGTKKR